MCKIRNLIRFFTNGAKVFREASRGDYREESESFTRIKGEIFADTNRKNDREMLQRDRKAVEGDICRAWNELMLSHG